MGQQSVESLYRLYPGMDDRTPRYRIGQLAERTGISPERLRAWQTRYGLLQPARSDGGFRVYSADDERRVLLMRRHLDAGLAAAQAASLARDGVVAAATMRRPAALPRPVVIAARRRMRQAFRNYDEAAMERALDELLSAFTVDAVLRDAICPFLRELGQAWEEGQATPGQEHFATTLIHNRLAGLARGWGTGTGRRALLAAPEGERHCLGLLGFGICLARRGWRITYLGPETPAASLVHAASRTRPELVVIACVQEQPWRGVQSAVKALATQTRVALGGHEAGEAIAISTGAEWVRGDPASAAATVDE